MIPTSYLSSFSSLVSGLLDSVPSPIHFHHGQCYFLCLCVKPVFLGGSSSRGGDRRLVPLELPFTDQPDGCCFHPSFPGDLLRCPHNTSPCASGAFWHLPKRLTSSCLASCHAGKKHSQNAFAFLP